MKHRLIAILSLLHVRNTVCHSFYELPYCFSQEYEREAEQEERNYNRDLYNRNGSPSDLNYNTVTSTWNRTTYFQSLEGGTSTQMLGRNRTNVRANVASDILRDLDPSVDPCDNFFRFACGGYIRRQSLPSGFSYKLGSIPAKINRAVRTALEERIDRSEPRPLRLAKRLFASCINEARVENGAKQDLLAFIRDLGGWPTLGYRTPRRLDLEGKLASSFAFFGNMATSFTKGGAIIGVRIQRDFFHAGRYCFFFVRPQLGQEGSLALTNHQLFLLPKSSSYTMAYIQLGVDIAVALGADYITAVRDMNSIVDFEIELAKIMRQSRAQVPSRALTISELTLRYPYFNWLRFLRLVSTKVGVEVNIEPSEKVLLWSPKYYDSLFPLLRRVSIRTISNYIIWRSILPFMHTMGKHFQQVSLKYTSALNGAQLPSLAPRNIFCSNVVSFHMPWVAGRILIERKMNRANLQIAHMVKDYLRQSFRNLVATANWIDERTRQNSLWKFDSIKDEVGLPDYLLNNTWIDGLYKDFVTPSFSFFHNVKSVMIQNFANNLRQLTNPHLDRWMISVVSAEAFYDRSRLAVSFSAGLMDEPVIHSDYPLSLIFAGYGFFHAHEYQHAFDSVGIQIDRNGVINHNFWSTNSKTNFNRKSQCFKRQMSSYFLPDIRMRIHEGQTTFDEALPDSVAIRVAYDAYQSWKSVNLGDDRLQGLPFTGNQLFFINYARLWCSKFSPEYLYKFHLESVHPLNRVRVIAPLQNMVEFSSTFQCPTGSNMSPAIKCSFW